VRVLIAGRGAVLRAALRLVLRFEPGVTAVASVASAGRLLVRARRTRPDLLLVDWDLWDPPVGGAAAAVARLRVQHPGLFLLALGGGSEARRAALAAGADAFVEKGEPPERLLASVRAAREALAGRRAPRGAQPPLG
jgi:two-component system response regulator DesR